MTAREVAHRLLANDLHYVIAKRLQLNNYFPQAVEEVAWSVGRFVFAQALAKGASS
jgi:hypothetical protein